MIYTIEGRLAIAGAIAIRKHISDYTLAQIEVGETGRGRKLDWLVVDDRIVEWGKSGEHPHQYTQDFGLVTDGVISTTRSGRKKLVSGKGDKTIIVFRSDIGYRGGNNHHGGVFGWECDRHPGRQNGPYPFPEECPECHESLWIQHRFEAFPGEKIAVGEIAQGDAGRAGWGRQIIAVVPNNCTVGVTRTGRLYGKPGTYLFQVVDGVVKNGITIREWESLDI